MRKFSGFIYSFLKTAARSVSRLRPRNNPLSAQGQALCVMSNNCWHLGQISNPANPPRSGALKSGMSNVHKVCAPSDVSYSKCPVVRFVDRIAKFTKKACPFQRTGSLGNLSCHDLASSQDRLKIRLSLVVRGSFPGVFGSHGFRRIHRAGPLHIQYRRTHGIRHP